MTTIPSITLSIVLPSSSTIIVVLSSEKTAPASLMLPNPVTGPMPVPSAFSPSPKKVRSTVGHQQEDKERMQPSAKIPSKTAAPGRFFLVFPLFVTISIECYYNRGTPVPFFLVPVPRGSSIPRMSALLNAFANRRISSSCFRISSGFPLALTRTTLQAWMAPEKVDLTVIGIFSLVGLPYTFKFLWSPLMDRFVPPFLDVAAVDAGDPAPLFLVIAAMAFPTPAAHPGALALLSFLVAYLQREPGHRGRRLAYRGPRAGGAGTGAGVRSSDTGGDVRLRA